MRKKKLFLAKFVGYSGGFFLIWLVLADIYVHIPLVLAQILLKLTGASDVHLSVDHHTLFLSGRLGGGGLSVLDVTLNVVFFLALCLAMLGSGAPENPRKRMAVGLAVLVGLHIAVLALFGYGFGHQIDIGEIHDHILAW